MVLPLKVFFSKTLKGESGEKIKFHKTPTGGVTVLRNFFRKIEFFSNYGLPKNNENLLIFFIY